ncbi:MAG: DUF484 family protein [Gammaproteobacteria bacterium]
MSTQRQPQQNDAPDTEITDESVSQHLDDNPDFFERHPALLAGLKLPHSTGGAAVSLVERQVSILRQRNTKLERKLRELISVARSNDSLSTKLHTLSLALMDARSMRDLMERLEQGLRQDFGADQTTLILFDDDRRYAGVDDMAYVRNTSASAAELKPFKTFLAGARPRCGQMRDAQRAFLFGNDNLHIGSSALVPLGDQSKLGILAIGNKDTAHFHPGMSTEFLGRLGDVISVALGRHALESAAA